MILETDKNAVAEGTGIVAEMWRFGVGLIPRAIIVGRTEAMMDINAVKKREQIPSSSYFDDEDGGNVQMREKYDTLFRVRGSVKIHSMMMVMTLHTMVQVAWLVIASIAIENVSMWDPITKTSRIV
jgi:hypothetical protein